MKHFEVINPADPITLSARDPLIAAAAAIALGRGRLTLIDERGDIVVPSFRGGSDVANAWIARTGIRDWDEWTEEHRVEIAREADAEANRIATGKKRAPKPPPADAGAFHAGVDAATREIDLRRGIESGAPRAQLAAGGAS